MDMHCRICGEPWDMDTLHDAIKFKMGDGLLKSITYPDGASTSSKEYVEYREMYDSYYSQMRSEFYSQGCKALYGYNADHCEPEIPKEGSNKISRSAAMGALIDILGDDLEGIASMMDDAVYMGMVEDY